MTTLAKILFVVSQESSLMGREQFSEAMVLMRETFSIESRWERGKTRTAYWVLSDGVSSHLSTGGSLSKKERKLLERLIVDVPEGFGEESDVNLRAIEVQSKLANAPK